MTKKQLLTTAAAFAFVSVASAATTVVNVSEDNFIDNGNGVQGGPSASASTGPTEGSGTKLNVATPNTSNIQQYTRRAYFGFNVSTVDLSLVTNVTFTATATSDVAAAYNGANVMRFYLVDNTINDAFDETTINAINGDPNIAPGYSQGDALSAQRIAGTIIGDVAIANPAAGQLFSVNFSSASLADLANDTNDFLTIVAEYRGQSNTGFNGANPTGLGFESKEAADTDGASLTFTTIPEPSSTLLVGLAGFGLLLRRR